MSVASHFAVYACAAEFLHRDLFAEYGFDYFGAGDKHFRNVFDHEYEVGQRGRINGAAGAGTQDHRNLRDHAAGQRIAEENLPIAGQRVDPFLNTRSAGVVDSDQRNAHVQGIVHDFGDLTCMHEAERTAGNRKVLCEYGDRLAADHSGADNHAVTRKRFVLHTEIPAVVFHENVVFMERSLVQQCDDTLTRGEFSHRLLLFYGFGSAAIKNFLFPMLEFENFFILY